MFTNLINIFIWLLNTLKSSYWDGLFTSALLAWYLHAALPQLQVRSNHKDDCYRILVPKWQVQSILQCLSDPSGTDLTVVFIIIITRPWPAFGRQGLVGSSGGYTYHGYTSHASPRACGARLGLQLWLGETKQNKTPWTLNLEHYNLPTFLPSSLPTFQPFIPTFQPSSLSTFKPSNLPTF